MKMNALHSDIWTSLSNNFH